MWRAAAPFLLLAACASPPPGAAPGAAATPAASGIPIEVLKPEGAGPFPAVVMLHDCSGLGPRASGAPRRWARELAAQGYVIAIPDSFGTRGFPGGVCTNPDPARAEVSPVRRVRDAYAALDHLRSLPFVDGARVAVMGGSHGGSTTLAALALTMWDGAVDVSRKQRGFAAAVALYPACGIGNPRFKTRYRAAAPLLILAGELDDWTPARACEQLAAAAEADGAPVTLKVYPGAHHSFDSASPVRYVPERNNANAPGGKGATTGGNADAWADARREVAAFLDRHLHGGR